MRLSNGDALRLGTVQIFTKERETRRTGMTFGQFDLSLSGALASDVVRHERPNVPGSSVSRLGTGQIISRIGKGNGASQGQGRYLTCPLSRHLTCPLSRQGDGASASRTGVSACSVAGWPQGSGVGVSAFAILRTQPVPIRLRLESIRERRGCQVGDT